MKKLFFCTAALLAAISFAACSDKNDDEENNLPATPENIAGTWQIVSEAGWEIDEGEKVTWSEKFPDEDGWYWTIAFDKNGTCVETQYTTGESPDTSCYAYSISDNKLTVTNTEYQESETFEIKKLTESQLILYYGTKSQESTQTYKRIE